MQPVEHLQPGTIFAKDFRVVRIVAQGGMGAVYEAEEVDGGRRVALKLMHPSQITDPKLRKRFAQEARVGAWIGSEHIVEVYCAGIDEQSHVPWLAMELLKGETLAARITKNLPTRGLPHDEAWRVLSQLCRALSAAHEKGVVHRDLKPENVFLTSQARTDAPFTVKVLDFGIAKRLDPNDRAQNKTAAIGTPLWMSPEQNENAEITPAAAGPRVGDHRDGRAAARDDAARAAVRAAARVVARAFEERDGARGPRRGRARGPRRRRGGVVRVVAGRAVAARARAAVAADGRRADAAAAGAAAAGGDAVPRGGSAGAGRGDADDAVAALSVARAHGDAVDRATERRDEVERLTPRRARGGCDRAAPSA